MLQDLDATLTKLLTLALPSSIARQVSISFATPDGTFPPTTVALPAIDLFLYDIAENVELRDKEPLVQRAPDGTVVRKPAPVRVECHYLITAWSRSGEDAQEEHKLLGEVLQVLLRYRQIPAEVLCGTMKEQPLPLRAVALRPSQKLARGDFWQALGGKPKAGFDYAVTLCVDSGLPEDAGAVVQSIKVQESAGP